MLIDGGFLRVAAKKAGRTFDPEFIERFALACRAEDETIFRILYYDCAQYVGMVRLPVSGGERVFTADDQWLHTLSRKDLFAIRRGVLKFRGWTPRSRPAQVGVPHVPTTDDDFKPNFLQKGVDMRIGLDIAAFAANRAIERVVLVSGDTDCIPALKYARKAGLQTVLVQPVPSHLAPELLGHADFKRTLTLASL